MAAKIILTALAVICVCGAASAQPALRSFDVLDSLRRVLAVVDANVKLGNSVVNGALERIQSEATESANQMADFLNGELQEALTALENATDATACSQFQGRLDAAIADLRNASDVCVDEQMNAVRASLATLKDAKTTADGILADAKVQLDNCNKQSFLGKALCLAQVMITQHTNAGTLATQTLLSSGKLVGDLTQSTFRTNECIAKEAKETVDEAQSIIEETTTCVTEQQQQA